MDLILSDVCPYSATYFSADTTPAHAFFISSTGLFTNHITVEHTGDRGSASAAFAEVSIHSIMFGGDNVTVRGREIQILDHSFSWK